jgi:hypothetical protein
MGELSVVVLPKGVHAVVSVDSAIDLCCVCDVCLRVYRRASCARGVSVSRGVGRGPRRRAPSHIFWCCTTWVVLASC